MSTSLYWKPVSPDANYLNDQLYFVLRERYILPKNFDKRAIPYLEGLEDCGVKGAKELVEAIREHGEVKVYEW